LVLGWWTTERLTNGGPSSWQSKADVWAAIISRMLDRPVACGIAVYIVFAIAACGSASEKDPPNGSAEAQRIETAVAAVTKTGRAVPGEEVKCSSMTVNAYECVTSTHATDDTGDVTLDTFSIVLFENRSVRVGFTGGRVIGSEPSEGAYDCKDADRDKCIEIARNSGGFRLIGPNGPLGARIPGSPDAHQSLRDAQ
jgi:hypothetical protein